MENNLLVNLRKYRPRDKSDPLENFLTEAFAHLLKSSDEVMSAVLAKLNEKSKLPKAFNPSRYEVSTQENFNGKFPDMLVKWDDVTIVFEHKVYSELSDSQLANYRTFAEQHFNHHYVVLITAREYQHKQAPDCAICWHDIYGLLDDIKPLNNTTTDWYMQSFKKLLQAEGLGKITPINQLAITHYLEAKALEEQMRSLLRLASLDHVAWPLGNILKPTVKDRLNAVESRIGIEFCQLSSNQKLDWKPGIFCGFLADSTDHKYEHITGKHMHVALIFDFNESLHDSLPSMPYFEEFRHELSDKIDALNASTVADAVLNRTWKVIDNMRCDYIGDVNWYHPFAVLMRMDAFFNEVHSPNEQLTAFVDAMSALQQLCLSCPSFQPFLTEASKQDSHV